MCGPVRTDSAVEGAVTVGAQQSHHASRVFCCREEVSEQPHKPTQAIIFVEVFHGLLVVEADGPFGLAESGVKMLLMMFVVLLFLCRMRILLHGQPVTSHCLRPMAGNL